jgi:hypothetical protein
MSDQESRDTLFALPAIDDHPSVEAGIVLMGLDAEQLLAGLAIASMTGDAGGVALLVDRARHSGSVGLPLSWLVAEGIRRWQVASASLAAAGFSHDDHASPRLAWTRAYRAVASCDTGDGGPASLVYLATCLLLHAEIDRYCQALPG